MIAASRKSQYPVDLATHPVLGTFLSVVMPLTPPRHQAIVLAALDDLTRWNLTQPLVGGAGVKAKARQWRQISGVRSNLNLVSAFFGTILGGGVGWATGMVIASQVDLIYLNDWLPLACAVVGAALGVLGGIQLAAGNTFHEGMIRVVVNERRSPVQPEKVTAQKQQYAPKVLCHWRSHEWRHDEQGLPYLWLQLPIGERVQSEIRGTMDCLMLPADRFRAKDSAVYGHRGRLRLVHDSALVYQDVERQETDRTNPLEMWLPWIAGTAIYAFSAFIFMLNASV